VLLIYSEACESRGAALKREYELKNLTRAEKEALVQRA
jgi:predicted GIY-YIG superfamily endonuclease